MGITKTEIFTNRQNKIASIAKVLGHPARIAILEHLLKVKSCICGDIVNEVGLSQPTISQHLREMKNIGLITGNIDGTKVCYCIDAKVYHEIRQTFATLFDNNLDQHKSC